MMLVTATLLPPSCDAIDPQKFSAAVTWILPLAAAGLAEDPDPHAAAATATSSSAPPAVARKFLALRIIGRPSGLPRSRPPGPARLLEIISDNYRNPKAFPLQLQWIHGPLPQP